MTFNEIPKPWINQLWALRKKDKVKTSMTVLS